MKALREWFGDRSALRRAYGSPPLTEAVQLADQMAAFFDEEGADHNAALSGPALQGLERVWLEKARDEAARMGARFRLGRANLTDGSASLDGWDTDKSIEGAGAVSPKGTTRFDQSNGGG